MSVPGNLLDVFLFEPGTDRHLGRLCKYSTCPKGKPDCRVTGCGDIPFNEVVEDFKPYADILSPARYATLYRRGEGRLRSALDLPLPKCHDHRPLPTKL